MKLERQFLAGAAAVVALGLHASPASAQGEEAPDYSEGYVGLYDTNYGDDWFYDEYAYSGEPAEGEPKEARGRILRTKRVGVPGADRENLVAMIQPEAPGSPLVVDFGPVTRSGERLFARGTDVVVEGLLSTVGSQVVLVAERFRAGDDDRLVEVRRTQRWGRLSEQGPREELEPRAEIEEREEEQSRPSDELMSPQIEDEERDEGMFPF